MLKGIEIIHQPDAIRSEWAWDPERIGEDDRCGDWAKGDDVVCMVYPDRDHGKTIVQVSIKPNKHHGRTTAQSDYYYLILKGSCSIVTWDNDEERVLMEAEAGDSFRVESGTEYDYVAGEGGLEATLFMNNLWLPDEEE